MAGINEQRLLGRLTADPRLADTSRGSPVCSFSVAVNIGRGEREYTEFFKVVLYGSLVLHVGHLLTKGTQVYIEGETRTSKYTDKQGVSRRDKEVIAREVQVLSEGVGQGSAA